MFREYEIRGVVDHDLAEVPQATFVGEVKSSQAMYDELANASGAHEMWVIPVTSIVDIDGVRARLDGGWDLFRASNTQLALVMRCEAVFAERLARIQGLIDSQLAAARRVTA
jgi:phosphomannomutase